MHILGEIDPDSAALFVDVLCVTAPTTTCEDGRVIITRAISSASKEAPCACVALNVDSNSNDADGETSI